MFGTLGYTSDHNFFTRVCTVAYLFSSEGGEAACNYRMGLGAITLQIRCINDFHIRKVCVN